MISVEAPPAFSHPAPPTVPSSGWETLVPKTDLRPDQSGWYPLPTNPDGVTATFGEASFVDGEVVVLPPSIDPDAPLHKRIAGFAGKAAVINGMDLPPDLYASYMRDLHDEYNLPGPRQESDLPPASPAEAVAAAAVLGFLTPPGWFRALCATTALALGLSSCTPRSVPISITAESLPQPGLTQLSPTETAPAPPTAVGEQTTDEAGPDLAVFTGIPASPPFEASGPPATVRVDDLSPASLSAIKDQGYQPLAFTGADGKRVIAEVWPGQDGSQWCTVVLPAERTPPDGIVDRLLIDPPGAINWPEAPDYVFLYGDQSVSEYGHTNGPGTADDEITARAIAGMNIAGMDLEKFTCATLIVTDPQKTPQEEDFAGATYVGLVEKETGKVTETVPMLYGPEVTIIFDGNAYVVDGQTLAFSLSPDGTVTTTLGPATPEPAPFEPGTVTFEPQMFESALPAPAAEALSALPGEFSRGWVNAETGQPVAIMYEDTATLDGRTVPLAKRYVFSAGSGQWEMPVCTIGADSVSVHFAENTLGIKLNENLPDSRRAELARALFRAFFSSIGSSFAYQTQDVAFDFNNRPAGTTGALGKKSDVQPHVNQIVEAASAILNANGGVANGRVGYFADEGLVDICRRMDVAFSFLPTDEFISQQRPISYRATEVLTYADLRMMFLTTNGSNLNTTAVSAAVLVSPEGALALQINVEPRLVQFWQKELGDSHLGASVAVGDAFYAGALVLAGRNSASHTLEQVTDPFAWFPYLKSYNYQMIIPDERIKSGIQNIDTDIIK